MFQGLEGFWFILLWNLVNVGMASFFALSSYRRAQKDEGFAAQVAFFALVIFFAATVFVLSYWEVSMASDIVGSMLWFWCPTFGLIFFKVEEKRKSKKRITQ